MVPFMCFFLIVTAVTEIYTFCHTRSLHDSLPIWGSTDASFASVRESTDSSLGSVRGSTDSSLGSVRESTDSSLGRSEENTSEIQSLMRISYAVFCLKTK